MKGLLHSCSRLLVTLIVICGLYPQLGCRKPDQEGPQTLVFGAILPLTGDLAFLGEVEQAALKAMAATINGADPDLRVRLAIEDCRGEAAAGVAAARKLLSVDRAAVLYTDLTTVAAAVAPITRSNQRIFIATAYATDLLSASPYSFRNLPTARQEAAIVFDWLGRRDNPSRKVALWTSTDEFGRSARVEVEELLKERGYELVLAADLTSDVAALRQEAAKIAHSQADAVYLASLETALGLAIREVRNQGYEGHLLTTDIFPYPYIYDAAGEAGQGVVYADFTIAEDSSDYQAWKVEFEKTSKSSSPPPNAILAAEALRVAHRLFSEIGGDDPGALVRASEGLTWDGFLGTAHVVDRQFIYPLEARVWATN